MTILVFLLNFLFLAHLICDKVFGFLVEHYRNQTYKLIAAINYIAEYCQNISLIIKIDDDVVFHPHFLLSTVLNNKSLRESITMKALPKRTIAGHVLQSQKIERTAESVYAVEMDVLPKLTYFPQFCAGFFIAMSGDVPLLLQPHIIDNEPFWIDDRFLGVLTKAAVGNLLDIKSQIDFTCKSVSYKKMVKLLVSKILVFHLPGKRQNHMSRVFYHILKY